MTTKKVSNADLGEWIGSMIAFDQGISNRLMADGWGAAEEWAMAYANLVTQIELVNNDVRVDRILSNSREWEARDQARHYRKMRAGFES